MTNPSSSQQQFGAHADAYVSSKVHAEGFSLRRMLELVPIDRGWKALDIATGGGHTARTLAPHIGLTLASDLTRPMLQAARRAAPPDLALRWLQCDAEALPFAEGHFDLVTCRIAPHHFTDVQTFVRESARVLKPGGWLAIADNVSSGEVRLAKYLNALEALRDPSHVWAWSMDDWGAFLASAGLVQVYAESFEKDIDFADWAARMGVTGDELLRLKVFLLRAPEAERESIHLRQQGEQIRFSLTEGIFIARRPAP